VIVLSDSGPLIALSKINYLYILNEFFSDIIIPQAVWTEVVEKGEERPGCKEVRDANWILVNEVKNILGIEALKHEIGVGESETIILAKELNADLVLIDDRIAKEIAISMGLNVTGTLAIIHEAIKRRIIHKDFREIVKMMKKNNIWINDEILCLFDE
jgi:predicted nucleic acid-binding protein